MIVKKFGGTSLGTPKRMLSVFEIVQKDSSTIVVLSAIAGTTNTLESIASSLYEERKEDAILLISELKKIYTNYIEELFSTKEIKEKAGLICEEHFLQLIEITKDLFTIHEKKQILAKGELLSTALFQLLAEEKGINSALISALDFMRIDESLEPNIEYIKTNIEPYIKNNFNKILITQGYICRNAFGEIDNLKRGGSDYTASIIGAAINAKEIQIWTDINGMHNNDPRVVKDTTPIEKLNFDDAAELAYFGAKILHPQSIIPAKRANIPVLLLNTLEPHKKGTLINSEASEKRIRAIAAKDNISSVRVKSSRMLLAYGFLRKVFEVFERYKTSIDLITTSEVSVSVTIDDLTYVKEITKELEQYGIVEVEDNFSIICIVGDLNRNKNGLAAQISNALKDIPIRMISYGGSDNNFTVLIKTSSKNEALNTLHESLFPI